jgi:hypothetical protein
MKTSVTFTFLMATAVAAPAAIIQFDLTGTGGAGLLFTSEPGVTSGGSGGGTANGFTNLTGASTNAHLHGPTGSVNGAGFTETAGPMINLQVSPAPGFSINTSASAGTITGTGTTALTPAQETALMEGRTYINVHTDANPGGEIRGFLVVIPEPATAVFGMAALGALALRRRRD